MYPVNRPPSIVPGGNPNFQEMPRQQQQQPAMWQGQGVPPPGSGYGASGRSNVGEPPWSPGGARGQQQRMPGWLQARNPYGIPHPTQTWGSQGLNIGANGGAAQFDPTAGTGQGGNNGFGPGQINHWQLPPWATNHKQWQWGQYSQGSPAVSAPPPPPPPPPPPEG